MTALLKRWIAASLLLIGSQAFAEGSQPYDVLPEPVPVMADGKVHVEEAFWYGCPHCFHLESTLEPWVKNLPADVEFTRVPAMFGRAWVSHAQMFYTVDALGLQDKLHTALFRALHIDKLRLLTQEEQRDFVVKNGGVSAEDFDKAYNSFTVKSRMKQGDQRIRSFNISGVPALIVQGKYVVSASTAGGQENMTSVVDKLIEQERAALKGK
ncbi:thiol:disulfide interchange protein DsbA/DsbL [Parathalassolituus penaei]|uniref:Thiol:disulfide interchange protein n=1 Tax=Parathalassolituus penaei TaxID=2997323 RepID=A0A9X3EJX3_9GAMM|nr:thiol:disulfide interchange protein DsbA/DsbL [Parathalassolituus penaei]MCY0965686.1 thiol:disulfide interchange protein DsbA/DsbL [Parathalassolituus penaei]